jgi:hypothetical protein
MQVADPYPYLNMVMKGTKEEIDSFMALFLPSVETLAQSFGGYWTKSSPDGTRRGDHSGSRMADRIRRVSASLSRSPIVF